VARTWLRAAVVWVGLIGLGAVVPAQMQATGAAGTSVATKKACSVISNAPTPAETALNKKQYSVSEGMYRDLLAKSAENAIAHEGLVRVLIEQDKVDAAAKDAEAWAAVAPENSMALTALGDVRLRQGNPREAFTQFQKAVRADVCNARAYFGLAEVDSLAGMHATSQKLIERAYSLHPTDDDIHEWWISTRQRKERLQLWGNYAEHSDQLNDDDRTKLKARLEKESQYHTSDCRMSPSSPREAKVPMAAVTDGPYRFLGWGLDVQFNGKRRRLQIDTGASGITISRAAAMFLGIKRDDTT